MRERLEAWLMTTDEEFPACGNNTCVRMSLSAAVDVKRLSRHHCYLARRSKGWANLAHGDRQ